jgi:hypothetical protein
VPAFPLFGYQFALPDRNHIFLVVDLMAIITKKLKEQFPQRLFIFAPEANQRVQVVIKGHLRTVVCYPLFVRARLKAGQDWGLPGLEEIDDQADPCVGT